jgi:ubiquitin-conjugating enzyme E2 O
LEVLLPDGTRTQVLESATTLIDKGFLRGDIVRPRRTASSSAAAPTRGQLGQIVDLETEVQVQRVLTGEQLEGWFAASDLVAATRINHGDHVVSGDWIGVVEEVFEMAMIELGDSGTVRRVCDIGNTFSVGAATDTIKQMLLERGEGILAMFLGASDFKRVNPFRSLPSFKSPPVG